MQINTTTYAFLFLLAIVSSISIGFSPLFAAKNESSCSFPRNLRLGDSGSDVMRLQQVLNTSSGIQVATTGSGSPGQESTYFGVRTQTAIIQFQEKYTQEILTPVRLSKGTGYVGISTRLKLAQLCAQKTAQSASRSTMTGSTASTGTTAASTAPSSIIATTSLSAVRNRRSATSTVAVPITTPSTTSAASLSWGVYPGGSISDLLSFEALVGKSAPIAAYFWNFADPFPTYYADSIGKKGKTLLIFWEPSFGYSEIANGSNDTFIKKFADGAKAYGYPVILVPFNEMNLNEEAWGYGRNGNNATSFKDAWRHMHDFFTDVPNVKFGLAYNNVSIPNIAGNRFADYYPGDAYVDYVGVDGFNFGTPWQSFGKIFDSAVSELSKFNKPLYIFATASAESSQKAAWITEGLGSRIKAYNNVLGWIWFNENKEQDWRINSSSAALKAFLSVLP